MTKIATTVNQEATAPSTGGSEYSLWLEYMNRGVQEWVQAYDWDEMRKTYFPAITGSSNATVSLPSDFIKLAASPRLHVVGDTELGTEYPEVLSEERGLYNSQDKYIRIGGNISEGYKLLFHPATLSSGASLEIFYYSMPTSMTAITEVPAVPDSQFLVDRTVAYIFEARSDPRFQQSETKARDRLVAMIENANTRKFNSYSNPRYVENTPERKSGFRIGRD